MKFLLLLLLSLSLSACRAQTAVRPTLEQLGSIYYAYPTPSDDAANLAPPTGYAPFYISHYGRHGSRWMTADERYTEVIQVFDSLRQHSGLTPLGEEVRQRLYQVWEDARGRSGNITPLGERQHREIARRMYQNYPQVFAGNAVIDARSSTSLRCAMSMSYFTERLKELNPSLQVTRRAYQQYMDYIAYSSPEAEAFSSEQAEWRKGLFRDFESRQVRPARLMQSLFKRPEAVPDADALMRSLYWIAADMQNVEPDLSFYDLFTYEELEGVWKTINARMYVCNAAAPLNGGLMPRQARNLLRNIVEGAEAAIRGEADTPAAHLRFGHDTHLIRLLTLMQLEGCCTAESDIEKFHLAWQDYRVSPMAANLQLIFYRNKKNDVLVKVLLNEEVARLPLKAVSEGYYRWEEVKQLWQLTLAIDN